MRPQHLYQGHCSGQTPGRNDQGEEEELTLADGWGTVHGGERAVTGAAHGLACRTGRFLAHLSTNQETQGIGREASYKTLRPAF